jgi:hypothetical protein
MVITVTTVKLAATDGARRWGVLEERKLSL